MNRKWLLIFAVGFAASEIRAGNSFDDLIRAHGGTVPQPFSELFRAIGRSSSTLIPQGRSRQRAQADASEPRFVVAQGQPDFADPANLFIGYAPRANQLEVIAWNREKGRYDFLEVTRYGEGLTPKVTEPSRDRCTICHQAEAPIFPRFPWSETIFNARVVSQILEARGGDPAYHGLKYDDPAGVSLVGTETSVDPGKLDSLVRKANQKIQAVSVIRVACESEHCRRRLVLAALIDPSYRLRGGRQVRALRARLSSELRGLLAPGWSESRFMYPSSVLPDRDPFGGRAVLFEIGDRRPLLRYAHPELFPESLILKADLNFEDRLADFVLTEGRGFTPRTLPFSPESPAHPIFRRPAVSVIEAERIGDLLVRWAHEALGLDRKHDDWLSQLDPASLERKTAELSLRVWPPDPSDLLRQIGGEP